MSCKPDLSLLNLPNLEKKRTQSFTSQLKKIIKKNCTPKKQTKEKK